jgi:hypothetical protein
MFVGKHRSLRHIAPSTAAMRFGASPSASASAVPPADVMC